ncbi:hypothetical protein EDB89DRAFT_1908938 [Lactarius sanguifluus]|nr:hypothetical protein EDB89DRAFT_1908938 [Lactarius sanguifluus]
MRGLSNSTIALLQMWQPSQPSLVSLQSAPRSASAALRSRHTARIDALYEVGDPWLPKHVLSTPLLAPVLIHGAHLSKEQAAELVKSWLKHRGVFSSFSMTHGGGWLTVRVVPVSQADKLRGVLYRLYRHTAVQVNGGVYDASHLGIERSIRTQYSEAVAYPTLLIFYSFGGELQVVAQQCDTYPDNGEQDPPPEYYATAICNLFAQLGGWASARGDDGVGKANCKDGSGKVWFIPYFLASCSTQAQVQLAHQTAIATAVSSSSGMLALPGSLPPLFLNWTAAPQGAHPWPGAQIPDRRQHHGWHKLLDARASFPVASFLRSASSILEQPVDL